MSYDALREEDRANARLIAAAPELLESLREVVNGIMSTAEHETPMILRAKAAITRATGAIKES